MRFFILCCLLALLNYNKFAYAIDDLAVNIKVDVTDQDASIAQQKALAGATRAAVIEAVKRISDQNGVNKFSDMNDDQIVNFIKETSVSDEKTSANRYIANLHLIVNTDLLQTYMNERKINISEQINPVITIIPVFSEFDNDTPKLWELDNLWRQAWDNYTLPGTPIINIIKDTTVNISALSAKQAYNNDIPALEEIKSLTNADDVYVLAASYNGIEGLNIEISSLSGYHDKQFIEGVKSSGNELFNKAIEQIIPILKEQADLLNSGSAQSSEEITVLFPFTELGDWVAAEQKIKSLNEVTDLQIQAFSPGKAQFVVHYNGNKDDLIHAIQAAGYNLEDSGNYMILNYIGD